MTSSAPKENCPLCKAAGVHRLGPVSGRDAVCFECPACGRYVLDVFAYETIEHKHSDRRHVFSAAARAAWDAKKPLTIAPDSIDLILASQPAAPSLLLLIDRFLLLLASRVVSFSQPARRNDLTDWPLIGARGPQEFAWVEHMAGRQGYFESGDSGRRPLSLAAWERIEVLRRSLPSSPQAFVAMWFDPSLESAWLEGIKPGIEDTGRFTALRVSDVEHNGKIDDRIVAEIRRSGLIVADFTGHRGGVYFEAGLGLGLGIPVIWTCRSDALKETHFDTRQYNHIVWTNPAELRQRLKDRIEASIPIAPLAAG